MDGGPIVGYMRNTCFLSMSFGMTLTCTCIQIGYLISALLSCKEKYYPFSFLLIALWHMGGVIEESTLFPTYCWGHNSEFSNEVGC